MVARAAASLTLGGNARTRARHAAVDLVDLGDNQEAAGGEQLEGRDKELFGFLTFELSFKPFHDE